MPISAIRPISDMMLSRVAVARSESSARHHADRQHRGDDQRIDEALELGRQDHVDEQQREQQRPAEVAEAALDLLLLAAGDED